MSCAERVSLVRSPYSRLHQGERRPNETHLLTLAIVGAAGGRRRRAAGEGVQLLDYEHQRGVTVPGERESVA